eukprot:UN02669
MPSVSLCSIDLFLNNANQTVPVGVYKEIPVLELKKLISSAFRLPPNIDIVGVHERKDGKNSEFVNPIIPLSYISRNPKAIDLGAKYQIITNNGALKSKPSLFTLFQKYWISILIATSICFILLPSIIYIMPEYVLLHRPILRNIYRNGPSYKIPVLSADLGFWNGKEINVICSEVSGQTSEFWNKNATECKQLFSQKVSGFIILIETSISVYLICKIFTLLLKFISSKILR